VAHLAQFQSDAVDKRKWASGRGTGRPGAITRLRREGNPGAVPTATAIRAGADGHSKRTPVQNSFYLP
jgi:hypothetical protein